MKNDQSITRAEMDENMQLIAQAFEKVATKDDLKKVLEPYATKDDLKKALEPYATKDDLKAYATKDDIGRMLISAIERIESSVVNVQHGHEKRITVLEKQR